jgi:hypothetical protein
MKNKFVYGVFLCVSLLMTAALSACSSDDDISGTEQVEQICNVVNSLTCYVDESGNNVYYTPVSSSDEAKNLVGKIILGSWDGKSMNFTLNDDCGTVRVVPGAESGQYATVVFSFTGSTVVTLVVVSEEYINGENRKYIPREQDGVLQP